MKLNELLQIIDLIEVDVEVIVDGRRLEEEEYINTERLGVVCKIEVLDKHHIKVECKYE